VDAHNFAQLWCITAQNSSDNLPSYHPHNHHSSDVVHWKGETASVEHGFLWTRYPFGHPVIRVEASKNHKALAITGLLTKWHLASEIRIWTEREIIISGKNLFPKDFLLESPSKSGAMTEKKIRVTENEWEHTYLPGRQGCERRAV